MIYPITKNRSHTPCQSTILKLSIEMKAASRPKFIIHHNMRNLCRTTFIHRFLKTEAASHPRDTLCHMIIPSLEKEAANLEKEAANPARVLQVVWMK